MHWPPVRRATFPCRECEYSPVPHSPPKLTAFCKQIPLFPPKRIIGNRKGRQGLGIDDFSAPDHFLDFIQRKGHHIQEFPFIQMLVCLLQMIRQVQIDFFIAESRRSIHMAQLLQRSRISGFLFQLPCCTDICCLLYTSPSPRD